SDAALGLADRRVTLTGSAGRRRTIRRMSAAGDFPGTAVSGTEVSGTEVPGRGVRVHLEPPGPEPVGLGRFGEYGGRFAPETLVPALVQLEAEFRAAWSDPEFRA